MDAWPSVSVIIPARNSESTISEALDGVYGQEYPGPLEVVVADGSDDETMAQLIRSRYPEVRIIENPDRLEAHGANRAIAASSGSIVARCDAHTVWTAGYLKRAVETLRRTGAAVVGGLQIPKGRSIFQRTVGLAMSSFLGAGDSSHKIGGTEGPSDTAYLGVFRRDALLSVNGYNQELIRNSDYDVNWRLRDAGEVVWLDPAMQVEYQPRSTPHGLWSQYFDYGWWKAVMIKGNIRSIRLRQLAAPALVAGLVWSIVFAILRDPWLSWPIPLAYLLFLALGSAYVTWRRRDVTGFLLPVVLPFMHVGWGLGFLISTLRLASTLKFSNGPAARL